MSSLLQTKPSHLTFWRKGKVKWLIEQTQGLHFIFWKHWVASQWMPVLLCPLMEVAQTVSVGCLVNGRIPIGKKGCVPRNSHCSWYKHSTLRKTCLCDYWVIFFSTYLPLNLCILAEICWGNAAKPNQNQTKTKDNNKFLKRILKNHSIQSFF